MCHRSFLKKVPAAIFQKEFFQTCFQSETIAPVLNVYCRPRHCDEMLLWAYSHAIPVLVDMFCILISVFSMTWRNDADTLDFETDVLCLLVEPNGGGDE